MNRYDARQHLNPETTNDIIAQLKRYNLIWDEITTISLDDCACITIEGESFTLKKNTL